MIAQPSVSEVPPPDAEARAHSARVRAAVAAEIAAAGGFLPFARYMELALFAPGLGYYASGATKFGAAGDFVTAPEMTPLFAGALARQVAAILAATSAREIVEVGAGSGRLAADLLAALAARDCAPRRYAILEPSPDLRARQQATLAAARAPSSVAIEWLDTLPQAIDGAVVANEVLDAVPAHVLVRRDGTVYERGVVIATRTANATAPRAADETAPRAADETATRIADETATLILDEEVAFAWAERPAGPRLAALAATRFPAVENYASEVNPAAEALVHAVCARLAGGAALFIDYGFPAGEYYHPQRSAGTLMCHYRHRAHTDPFAWPGLTDITAHVDFSAMATAGMRAGLQVAGFAPLASFLVGCGILDELAATGAPDSLAYIKAAAPVQKLLSPAEMGELFKVLALAKSPDIAWPGFALGEHSRRL